VTRGADSPPFLCNTHEMLLVPQIAILAAGAAKRMRGADKLLETVDDITQLRRIAHAALLTGTNVYVTLSSDYPLRDAALKGLAVIKLPVAEAAEGMSASIRVANAAIPSGPIMLLLADLPEITTADLRQMISAHNVERTRILRATSSQGVPGHPVILPNWVRHELKVLTGDSGAFPVLQRHAHAVRLVPLPGTHATTDLDTPEDWAAWRASRGA
jgi:molybdenum cofactor cytidylyltransferase